MATLAGTATEGRRTFRWLRRLPAYRYVVALMALVTFVALDGFPRADAGTTAGRQVSERQIKAAYLSKFGSYVEWPEQVFASGDSPLSIGVIGDEMLAEELARIAEGRTANGRPVTVHRLRHDDAFAGINILFIGRSQDDRLAEILARTKARPILTVTESPAAIALGSTINFVIIDGNVRFDVAPKTAELAGLRISARLLAAAHKVVPGAS